MAQAQIFSLQGILDSHEQRMAEASRRGSYGSVFRMAAWKEALLNLVEDKPLVAGIAFALLVWLTQMLVLIISGVDVKLVPTSGEDFARLIVQVLLSVGGMILVGGILSRIRRTVVEVETHLREGIVQIGKLQEVSIQGFAKISDTRDPFTGKHVERMAVHAKIIAEELSKVPKYASYISPQYIKDLHVAAPLHDIGKVGIADKILKKKGALTLDEFEIMKLHTVIGGDLMAELERKLPYKTFYSLGKEIAYHHHQRYDGTGYPNVLSTGGTQVFVVQAGLGEPLKGQEIPLSARIVAVADVYDALVSKRVYKDAYPHEIARDMVVSERGKHFDPEVVDAFLSAEERILEAARQHKD